MATSWVLGKISDALQPAVHSTVSTAGSFAGGALNTVGAGISGVGESINGTIKRYGDGVRDYGNGVMDWSNATGGRAQTASNPLGLSSGASTGKRSVTSPSIYSATPRSKPNTTRALTTTNKTGQPQKKIQNTGPKKPSPVVKTNPPIKKMSNVSTKATPVSKPVQGANKPVLGSAPRKATPVKATTAPVNRAKLPSVQKVDHIAATNPLGLK